MSILTPAKPPYINYHETDSNPLLDGEGAEIPVFIGRSPNIGNAKEVKIYKNYSEIKMDTSNGGIGLETTNFETTNPLLFALKEFFIEASGNSNANNNLGVPRVYVVDLGNEITNEKIITVLNEIKKYKEIGVVAFVGLEPEEINSETSDDKKKEIIKKFVGTTQAVFANLLGDTADNRFKEAYFRLRKDATETEMASFSSKPTDKEQSINEVRINLIEYNQFGKIIARICCTEYYIEPGYPPFNTVELGTFKTRTPTEKQILFNAGVIFGEDDYRLENPVPRICIGTTTAFGKDIDERPNDCLLHARRNADHQIKELLKIIAPQLKRNETSTNILYLQSDCKAYLDSEKNKGRIMDYSIQVKEADDNPYNIEVIGDITPVNATYAIDISCYINSPFVTVADQI